MSNPLLHPFASAGHTVDDNGAVGDGCWLKLPKDEESDFFGKWTAHHIGWVVCGGLGLIAVIVGLFLIIKHLANYTVPNQQRYVVRILFMVPLYAILTFFSYRYYAHSPYWEAARDTYESIALASFFVLILQYVGESHSHQRNYLAVGERRKLLFPLNCLTFDPARPSFLLKLKWGVLQYSIIRPLTTIVTVVLHALGYYCPSSMSPRYGHLYIAAIVFISVSIALYALLLLYTLVKDDIKSHRPFLKFMCIKMVIFFTFWQATLLSILASPRVHVIKPTKYWTSENISVGINALLINAEMVIFALLHLKAFPATPYISEKGYSTSLWTSLLDVMNPIHGWRDATETVKMVKNVRAEGKAYDASNEGSGEVEQMAQANDSSAPPGLNRHYTIYQALGRQSGRS
ncbi:DUF300-domain-containing protein [Ramicandelaber brevisporus]|nr:DUF300-domain-containing protein [Ramicandelaber brevisporus]